MLPSRGLTRAASLALLLCVPSLASADTPVAKSQDASRIPSMYDARVNRGNSAKSAKAARITAARAESRRQSTELAQAVAGLKRTMPGVEVKLSGLTGGPSEVINRGGTLTAAAPGRGSEEIVREFLSAHGEIYGLSAADLADLVVLGDSPGGPSGLRMLRMEQRIDGRPVFQSETRFLLDRQGRLVKSTGLMVPGARAAVSRTKAARLLTPAEAVTHLVDSTGQKADPAQFTVTEESAEGWTQITGQNEYVAGPASVRQVLFPLAPGVLVDAWSVVVFTSGKQDWYAVVDAETGEVLWRKNIRNYVSNHDARFRVYVQADGVTPAESPAPWLPSTATPGSGAQAAGIAPTIVSMHTAMDAVASPNGWIDDCTTAACTANESQTLGNNALVCLDREAPANVCDTGVNSVVDGNGRSMGNPDANGRNRDFLGTAPRDFETNFLPPPQGGNPEAGQTATGNGAAQTIFRRGAMVHTFYAANWYHDQLFRLGFDEAAGNFQQTNFSGMGLGGDRILVDAQDASSTNNANFGTPPDGISGRAQMFRFTGPTIDRDGGLDTVIFLHELSHGTSNRLVGNAAGLNWDPAVGMGEGWSDFIALALLNNTNAASPTGSYPASSYSTYKIAGLPFLDNYVYGIRRFPYSTDLSVNPLTWGDVDDVTMDMSGGIPPSPIDFSSAGGAEVHNSGEVWAVTLWSLRNRIIADPAGANGDVPTGNQTALQLVIDGLKMTPIDPTFPEARDAILDADCATNACANEEAIWQSFAERGLGWGAKQPLRQAFGYVAGHISIKESFRPPYLDVVNSATDVTLDDSLANNNGAIDPGEPVQLTVRLTNPWRAAGKAVAGATATLTTTTPGVTILDGTSTYGAIAPQGSATGDSFTIALSPAALCGSPIDFTVTTTSSLGTTTTTFQLRVGAASGTGTPVTYSSDPNPNIVIPDWTGQATLDSINITDDFVIADLDFRVDSITHTYVNDLMVGLRSPAGTGMDLIGFIGLGGDGGSGTNLTNLLIDDDLPFTEDNDMIFAVAPYSGPYFPLFNSPTWPLLLGPDADPVGNLSYFDGESTLGTWTALVTDQFSGDTGTFNAWSMIVTPVAFTCAPFAATASLTATKTVSGSFVVGGTVTYTVTLTNNGTGTQGDNAGDELTDVLPAGLTLTGATATSGTAAMAGNTVTWNGSLAPFGGSVTITITATIDAGTLGNTISNQGTASVDSDNDNTNDTSVLTDDPGVGGAADPTTFVVGGASLTAVKTVSGTYTPESTVTYTIVLANNGASPTADNPGDELTDVLPSSLTLVGASATAGTATATLGTNTVTWNGSVPASGTVTITITATINAGAVGTISNQATFSYDADLNGTNESTGSSDAPGGGANDPTTFVVAAAVSEIPTVSEVGMVLLALSLMAAAWTLLRRRKMAV